MNYCVATKKVKEDQINFRIRQDIKEELRITAESRGMSVSGLIHHLIVRSIQHEKEEYPERFAEIKNNFAEASAQKQTEENTVQDLGDQDITRNEIKDIYIGEDIADVVDFPKSELPEGFGLIGHSGSTSKDIEKISKHLTNKRKKKMG